MAQLDQGKDILLSSSVPWIIWSCHNLCLQESWATAVAKLVKSSQKIGSSSSQCQSVQAAQCMQKDGLGICFYRKVHLAPIGPQESWNGIPAPSCQQGMWWTCSVGPSAPLERAYNCRRPSLCLGQKKTGLLFHGMSWRRQTYQGMTQTK